MNIGKTSLNYLDDRLPKLAIILTVLAFLVIILGAYTRLTDSGLGCPDWPGCYGRLIAPINTVGAKKAWIEMLHRYIAGSFGILTLVMVAATMQRKFTSKHKATPAPLLHSIILLMVVVFQALLGMWTVTLKLYPIIVLAHLLGGMTILVLSLLLALKLNLSEYTINRKFNVYLSYLAIMVVALQIALGGWTSANYAALVCSDFPSCQGSFWPIMDWKNAFTFTAVGIFDSPGIPLENAARVTIQMAHRLGAMLTTIIVGWLAFSTYKTAKTTLVKNLSILTAVLLGVQILLGITNIFAGLPLAIAVMHNAVAASLLLAVVSIGYVS